MPPAAPAPLSRDVRRSVAVANASSQPSTSAMRSSAMPFCGPKVLVAPKSPVSGMSTSLAATRVTPARRSRAADRSTWPTPARRRRPGVERHVRRRPERGEQAGPAVVGARAAEPDHDGPGAGVHRGQQQLAHPAAGRRLGVAVDQVEAGRLRALDVRRVADPQHHGRHGRAVRTADGDRRQLPAERRVEHVDEARPPVRHRCEVELVVRARGGASPRRWRPRPAPR